jgi:hypothetical protein
MKTNLLGVSVRFLLATIFSMLLVLLGTQVAQAQTASYKDGTFYDQPRQKGIQFFAGNQGMGTYDPIVFPGQDNVGHLHEFYCGNVIPGTLTSQLFNDRTLCGKEDHHSGYWHPALINKVTGEPQRSMSLFVYYRRNVEITPYSRLRPVPPGLKVIAGSSSSTGGQYGVVDWGCGGANGSGAAGNTRGYALPQKCDPNSKHPAVKSVITFPNCIQKLPSGELVLDSPDHKSHMRYASEKTGLCPDGFKYQIPIPVMSVKWPISNPTNYELASHGLGSMHGDLWAAHRTASFRVAMQEDLQ